MQYPFPFGAYPFPGHPFPAALPPGGAQQPHAQHMQHPGVPPGIPYAYPQGGTPWGAMMPMFPQFAFASPSSHVSAPSRTPAPAQHNSPRGRGGHARPARQQHENSSRSRPEPVTSGDHPCVPCDRQFPSSNDLTAHIRTHITCDGISADGKPCTFTACKRVVTEHASRAHRSGTVPVEIPDSLLELIPAPYRHAHTLGDTPDEISKWRAERRRRFPTAANVATKVAVRRESEVRGAVLPPQAKRPRLNDHAPAASVDIPKPTGDGKTVSNAVDDEGEPEVFQTDLSSLLNQHDFTEDIETSAVAEGAAGYKKAPRAHENHWDTPPTTPPGR
jgi:hypothetical protein